MPDHDMHQLAHHVADHLGNGWQVDPDHAAHDAYLTRPDGGYLHLHAIPGQPARIGVMDTYPPSDYHHRADERPHITVRADRGPAILAREITRRLLPTYENALAAVHAHLAKQASDTTTRIAVAARLAAHLPGADIQHDDRHHRALIHWYSGNRDTGRGRIELDQDATTTSLTLYDIPTHLAEQMLATIGAGTPQPDTAAPPAG
jgi:hypothetical protein